MAYRVFAKMPEVELLNTASRSAVEALRRRFGASPTRISDEEAQPDSALEDVQKMFGEDRPYDLFDEIVDLLDETSAVELRFEEEKDGD